METKNYVLVHNYMDGCRPATIFAHEGTYDECCYHMFLGFLNFLNDNGEKAQPSELKMAGNKSASAVCKIIEEPGKVRLDRWYVVKQLGRGF